MGFRVGVWGVGQHNGLPCTIIVSTTLQDLQSAAGVAVTAGGTLLSMPDVIGPASQSHHYLVIYDKHTREPLYCGRAKRFATPGQRIVLHALDRGCTRPGCTAPGYWCEVHHVDGWAVDGETNINELTLALWPGQPPGRRGRLDHAKAQRRPHGMDPTTAPRYRTVTGQRLPPSREVLGGSRA